MRTNLHISFYTLCSVTLVLYYFTGYGLLTHVQSSGAYCSTGRIPTVSTWTQIKALGNPQAVATCVRYQELQMQRCKFKIPPAKIGVPRNLVQFQRSSDWNKMPESTAQDHCSAHIGL